MGEHGAIGAQGTLCAAEGADAGADGAACHVRDGFFDGCVIHSRRATATRAIVGRAELEVATSHGGAKK